MDYNKFRDFPKCGEILIDTKSIFKKSKVYIFNCTFCNMESDQLKKFSNHIEEKHLNDLERILKGTELIKVEPEPEEFQCEDFTMIERPDLNIFYNSKDDNTSLNKNVFNSANTDENVTNQDILNCEKNEFVEIYVDESSVGDREGMDCNASEDDSDKEAKENLQFSRASFRNVNETNGEIEGDIDQVHFKKRKVTCDKNGKDLKQEAITIESSDDELNNLSTSISKESLLNSIIKQKIMCGSYKVKEKVGRSRIWKVFGNISNNGIEIKKKVACRKCCSVLKYDAKSLSNLAKHKCYAAMKSETNLIKEEVNDDIKKEAIILFSEWCIENCRPLHFVRDNGLKRYSEFLFSVAEKYGLHINIDSLLPHPAALSRNIQIVYDSTIIDVKEDIVANCKNGYGLTSDMWTDNYLKKTYISFTLHYIKNGQLTSRLLGLHSINEEKCTSDIIRSKAEKLLEMYNCKLDDGVMVMGRRSNVVAAFNTFPNINCINHLLDNVIISAIEEVDEVEKLCSLCSKVVKYLNRSVENCKINSTLKSLCPTRWNKTYYMLDEIEKNWKEIENIPELKNEIQLINISRVKGVVYVLESFEQAYKILKGKKYPTLHLVYAYINGLMEKCIPDVDDIEEIKKFKDVLCHHMRTNVLSKINMIHKIAHFLFPPANKLLQFTDKEKEDIKSECADQLKKYIHNESDETNVEPSAVIPNKIISSYFKNFVTPASISNSNDKIFSEIKIYENLDVPFEENFDVINWWQLNQAKLPLLYKLSCKILATPASSAASERVFSIARQLLVENGADITANSETFNHIMFLNMNVD